MYFFQDDIGLLVQHSQYNFWQFLIFPQAEHFVPLLHALTWLEFKLFHLNFYGYFFVSFALHLINLYFLYRILVLLKLRKSLAVIVSSLFIINLTFVEPLLWFSAQGVILANIFISLAFYFWLIESRLSYVFLLASSFSYSTGLGLGFIFGILSLTSGRFKPFYFLIGIFSFFVGPVIAGNTLGRITPQISAPFLNSLQFLAFVIGGMGRGVFGRLFLPGFEPRHFEITKTLISFLPFALVSSWVLILQKSYPKIRPLLFSLSLFIIYPYIWAGTIRYQFGIKQALAERYAYTPLFFALILLGILLNYFFDKKINSRVKPLTVIVGVILIFQTIAFHKKAVEFEIRPMQTKKFIEGLKLKLKNNQTLPGGSFPAFVNQPLKVSDLYPILKPH